MGTCFKGDSIKKNEWGEEALFNFSLVNYDLRDHAVVPRCSDPWTVTFSY